MNLASSLKSLGNKHEVILFFYNYCRPGAPEKTWQKLEVRKQQNGTGGRSEY